MRINHNCASPCKASGHLQKPYLKHRCPEQSTIAFPSPILTESSNQALFILLHKRLFSQLSFSICFSLSFIFQCVGRKFTANTEEQHSQQQPGFSSGGQLSPTHHCIPAKWWDVSELCKIHKLWLQTSMCNSWFKDSLRDHNGNICHCTFKVWCRAFFLFDLTSKHLNNTTLKCNFPPYHSASKSFVSSHNLSVTLHCSFASSAFSSLICGSLLAISCIGFISAAARSNSFSNSVNDFILY